MITVSPNARFLAGAVPHRANERVRLGNSIIGSAFMHIGGFLLPLFIIGTMPVTPPPTDAADDKPSRIAWLKVSGPGRRAGSPGDGKPAAPRQAERPAGDTMTHPEARPPKLVTEINIPAVNISAGVVDLPGALTGLAWSHGSDLGGAGRGSGRRGSGLGTGNDNGTGDGPFGAGSGVTMPTVLREVKPGYTAEAMRAKIQGAVMVEAIVREDGSVGQVRIVRSLDRTFGLDEEALKAVSNWRFSPGKRQGKNVAVIVEIELTFTLR